MRQGAVRKVQYSGWIRLLENKETGLSALRFGRWAFPRGRMFGQSAGVPVLDQMYTPVHTVRMAVHPQKGVRSCCEGVCVWMPSWVEVGRMLSGQLGWQVGSGEGGVQRGGDPLQYVLECWVRLRVELLY